MRSCHLLKIKSENTTIDLLLKETNIKNDEKFQTRKRRIRLAGNYMVELEANEMDLNYTIVKV